ncbi:MAG: hypothetical protein EZS28_056183, partial [Streblomastix strix]
RQKQELRLESLQNREKAKAVRESQRQTIFNQRSERFELEGNKVPSGNAGFTEQEVLILNNLEKQAMADKDAEAVDLVEASTDAEEEEKIKKNGHLGDQRRRIVPNPGLTTEQLEEQLLWELAVRKDKDKLRTIFLLDGYRRSGREIILPEDAGTVSSGKSGSKSKKAAKGAEIYDFRGKLA